MGWTRNYYNLLTAFLLGDTTETSVNTPVDYQPPIVVRTPNGSYTNILGDNTIYHPVNPENAKQSPASELEYYYLGLAQLMNIGKINLQYATSNPGASASVQFGSGDTAADYEDYNLETPITSGLTLVAAQGTLTAPSAFDSVTHKYSSTRTFTVNNSGNSSITIKELGIFCMNCLVYREVLGSPITIDPGESVTVSFTREATVFNYTPYT